jgi:prepilin signal peptidase PulO-like enzyme (type II secretory pathway)
MDFIITIYLAFLGLALGSFVNAFVWRLHHQELEGQRSKIEKKKQSNSELLTPNYSVLRGRSMCPNCKHQLAWNDLIPLFSWLALKGRCRYCQKPISKQYPIVELLSATLFVVSYIFWPVQLNTVWQTIGFASWLIILTGLVALLVYDYKWMILPDVITYPLIMFTVTVIVLQFVLGRPVSDLGGIFLSAIIGGGFFWLIYQLSKGNWIGGGDVKLGFLLGLVLATPMLAVLCIFLASVFGMVYSLPMLASKKLKTSSKVPFGPFLIAGAITAMLFGRQITDLYLSMLLI